MSRSNVLRYNELALKPAVQLDVKGDVGPGSTLSPKLRSAGLSPIR